MSLQTQEQELNLTGGLLSISILEDKLTKNFMIINSKLKKLDNIHQLDQKIKHLQKELKFLTMKVETIVQKLPKDGGSLNRNDVKIIAKDQLIDLLNSQDEKVVNSKLFVELTAEIAQIRQEILSSSSRRGTKSPPLTQEQAAKMSFTAGQSLLGDSQTKRINKDTLKECLDDNEMNIINDIIDEAVEGSNGKVVVVVPDPMKEINQKIQDLYKQIEALKLGKGYNYYAERQAEKFEKYQQFQQKSKENTKRMRNKPLQLQGFKPTNLKGELLKNDLYSQVQRAEILKQQISRQELLSRKTMQNIGSKQLLDTRNDVLRRPGEKILDTFVDEPLKRGRSVKKHDRRLKLDDIKDINSVLREIQLRIEGKVSHDTFIGFVKDFEEKIEIIRITKDFSLQSAELRKIIYGLESKVQALVGYIQTLSGEDEALLVRKQWACVSCDKNIEKYSAKVGQHLNWQQMAGKKISPTKAGAFGQTGQLATKIRNLMQGGDGQ